MKRKLRSLIFFWFFLPLLTVTPCLAVDPPQMIRGVIAGYQYGSYLIVKTDRKQFILIKSDTSGMNPIPDAVLKKPEKWTFAVRPSAGCGWSFSVLRFEMPAIRCGNETPEEQAQPAVPPVAGAYPQLSFISEIYRKELDAMRDETVLTCYDLDRSRTKPSLRERLAGGIVLGNDGQPIPDFVVSIGFAHEKNSYLFVKTDAEGKFSIPIFENYAYLIRAGVPEREILIPKNTVIKPLVLNLGAEKITGENTSVKNY